MVVTASWLLVANGSSKDGWLWSLKMPTFIWRKEEDTVEGAEGAVAVWRYT
jgi:hypothetical protein